MHAAGATNGQIAKALGVRAEQVSRWLHEPAASAVRESTIAKARERAESLADDAMGTLEEIMRGQDRGATAADRRAAAIAILDRVGVVAGTRIEHSGAIDLGRVSDADLAAQAEEILTRRGWKPKD